MKEKVEKIIAHGINCFINRQLIYNYPEQLFADAGVMAIGEAPPHCRYTHSLHMHIHTHTQAILSLCRPYQA